MGVFLFLEVKTKIRLKRAASGAGVLFNITGGTWRRGRGEGREEGGEVVVGPRVSPSVHVPVFVREAVREAIVGGGR